MRVYVLYSCNGEPTIPDKCTTRWPESVSCTIHLSVSYNGKRYNLMNMDGDESAINAWLAEAENSGKVITRTREQFAAFIEARFPVGTYHDFNGKRYTLDSFDVDTGPVFTVTDL